MCDSIATSKEHAPPICFFPEKSDLPAGQDFKVNLITVPSCEEHNGQKSKDDEFIRMVVSTCFVSNEVALRYIAPHALRGFFENNAAEKIRALRKSAIPLTLERVQTIGLTIPIQRFNSAMDRMARAVYHYHHRRRRKWTEPVEAHCPSLYDLRGDKRRVNEYRAAVADVSSELSKLPRHGSNQAVFYYQLFEPEHRPSIFLRMVFYDGFEYVVISDPDAPLG